MSNVFDSKAFDFLSEFPENHVTNHPVPPASMVTGDRSKADDATVPAVEQVTAEKEVKQALPINIHKFEPSPDLQLRLAQVKAATNPLLEAAQPLLRALADMPAELPDPTAVEGLRGMLVREVSAFQAVCDKAGLPWKHMAAIRYCICTALDEAANGTSWGGGGVWAMRGLLITFEGEVEGGEKFFLLIGRMAIDPQEYVNVLEILLRILGLGFEGRYSVVEDGRRHLDQIRQRLLTLIDSAREPLESALSPHWRGEMAGRLKLLRSVPIWISVVIFGLLLFALFSWYKYQLLHRGIDLQQRILAIAKEPARLAPVQALRLSILLKDEIARGLVMVDENTQRSSVIFKGDYMFMSGKSEVRPEVVPILDKVAQEIARVGGQVFVTGHTDNQPIHTAQFPNNQVLSEKRATLVGDYLKKRGIPASQIKTMGSGDTQPVADNATAAGRDRNRRVEISVTHQ